MPFKWLRDMLYEKSGGSSSGSSNGITPSNKRSTHFTEPSMIPSGSKDCPKALRGPENLFQMFCQAPNVLIGGSTALYEFTKGDPRTKEYGNDVDVFIGGSHEDVDSFDAQVSRFVEAGQGHIVKTNVFCEEDMRDIHRRCDSHDRVKASSSLDPDKEDFHKDIFKTVTVHFPDSHLPVQFVGIGTQDQDLRTVLTSITDIPSSVTFSYDGRGQRIYQIPQKLLPSLWTREVPIKDICPARVEKYGKRGYTFYE